MVTKHRFPDDHKWTPTSNIVNFGGNKPDYQMMQVCVCGAYQWIKAFRVDE